MRRRTARILAALPLVLCVTAWALSHWFSFYGRLGRHGAELGWGSVYVVATEPTGPQLEVSRNDPRLYDWFDSHHPGPIVVNRNGVSRFPMWIPTVATGGVLAFAWALTRRREAGQAFPVEAAKR
jgi:hypothetical protein